MVSIAIETKKSNNYHQNCSSQPKLVSPYQYNSKAFTLGSAKPGKGTQLPKTTERNEQGGFK